MLGISRYTGIDLPVLAAISAIYDMTASGTIAHHACTGILAQNSEGKIIHGRNRNPEPFYPDSYIGLGHITTLGVLLVLLGPGELTPTITLTENLP